MKTQLVLDLCSGIGGFTLGGTISGGFQTVAFCEINEYCQQILSLRFPQIPIISDIRNVTADSLQLRGIHHVNGITAGLPCPAFSVAGKRLGSQDERNLFPEFFRIIRDVRPRWAIVENVPGLLTVEQGRFFVGVLREFATIGYDVEWSVISAASVGAVHKRERLWIIAHTNSNGCNGWAGSGGAGQIHDNLQRNTATPFEDREQLLLEPREIYSVSANPSSKGCREGSGTTLPTANGTTPDSNCWQQEQSHGRNFIAQGGTDPASFLCCDDGNSSQLRCQRQLEATNKGRQKPQLGNWKEPESLSQSNVCIGDDGISSLLDGYLLRRENLEEWLVAATIPKFTRLGAKEVGALTREEQAEYRACWKEYQVIRRQHKQQLKSLGNAIVPSCAAVAFDKLKLILK